MTKNSQDDNSGVLESSRSPAEALRQQIVAIFDSFHNHTCQSCKGSGCINCRDTGMNQTPCLVCDEDGIAYRRRKKHVDEIMELVTAYAATVEREGRIDEMELLDKTMDDDYSEYHWPSEDGEYYDVNKYIVDRLAALQGPEGRYVCEICTSTHKDQHNAQMHQQMRSPDGE